MLYMLVHNPSICFLYAFNLNAFCKRSNSCSKQNLHKIYCAPDIKHFKALYKSLLKHLYLFKTKSIKTNLDKAKYLYITTKLSRN